MNRQNFSHFPFAHLLLLQRSLVVKSGVSLSRSRLLIHPFTLHPYRWTNRPQRVLKKRLIETKVPPGTPDAVMAQTGTEKKNMELFCCVYNFFVVFITDQSNWSFHCAAQQIIKRDFCAKKWHPIALVSGLVTLRIIRKKLPVSGSQRHNMTLPNFKKDITILCYVMISCCTSANSPTNGRSGLYLYFFIKSLK
jgi:hypothetical protein